VALTIAVLSGTAFAGWWDGVGDSEPIDLRKIVESPHKYKGKEVTFTCYFHEVSEFYNPYYTRFLPAHYVNFSVWPAGSRLWRREEYANSFKFLFLEKDHKYFSHLMGMKKFTHLKLRGYVQNTFKNVPWIEIRGVEVLGDGYTRDCLREVILADRAVDRGDWATALQHLDKVNSSGFSGEVQASLLRKRGQVLESMGNLEGALLAYRQAMTLYPEDSESETLLIAVSEKLGQPYNPEEPAPAMADSRPVDEGRYPPKPMAMPAPVEMPAEPAAAPEEMAAPDWTPKPIPTDPVPLDMPEKTAPAAEPAPVEAPVEVDPEVPAPAPLPKKTPKKRMSGPV
jgi:hypothetical protein